LYSIYNFSIFETAHIGELVELKNNGSGIVSLAISIVV
jgi:hypothetical protein